MSLNISIKNQHFTLHPFGAMFWKEKSLLLISDVHLGKVGHFRKFGAAVPRKAIHQNFLFFDKLVHEFQPFQICFLGDLFHSSLNKEWQLFENWVSKTPSRILLVAGNHDIIATEKFEQLGIEVFDELILDEFLLTHYPTEHETLFNFCGHIHPAVRLKGLGRQTLRLPCFFKSKTQMVLPAFGTFTGSHVLEPKESDQIFALTKEAVVPIEIKQQ